MRFPLIVLLRLLGGMTGVVQRTVLAWRLFRDSRVPVPPKAIPTVSMVYAISPLDVIPDWVVGPGHLDDLVVFLAGLWLFVAVCPRQLVQEHRRAISWQPLDGNDNAASAGVRGTGTVVDVEARVVDK